jgi:hypothetical protein
MALDITYKDEILFYFFSFDFSILRDDEKVLITIFGVFGVFRQFPCNFCCQFSTKKRNCSQTPMLRSIFSLKVAIF